MRKISPLQPRAFHASSEYAINERARAWAIANQVSYLVEAGMCAHVLYTRRACHQCFNVYTSAGFDHAGVWVPVSGRPFILSQVYSPNEVLLTIEYARINGLVVTISKNGTGDNWYGYGTTAVRLSAPES